MTQVFEVSITDTFGGQANYSWLDLREVYVREMPTQRALIRAVKKQCGLVGRHKATWLGEVLELSFPKDNIVAFVQGDSSCA